MPRTVEITVPAPQIPGLVEAVRGLPLVLSIRHQRESSLDPPGDVLLVEVANHTLPALMRVLARHRSEHPEMLIVTRTPEVLIGPPSVNQQIQRDSTDSAFEEMDMTLGRESNMTRNALLVMAVAGVLVTLGFHQKALYLVIAAMVIAPGFEPLSRIGLGVVARSSAWRRGVSDVLVGYAALVLAATVTALVVRWTGGAVTPEPAWWLSPGSTVYYWNQLSPANLVSSFVAGLAGAVLVATHRSVLTFGVMITLSLIPAAGGIGMGLSTADWTLLGSSALRLVIEFALVISSAILVFTWKSLVVKRRPTMI